MNKLDSDEKEKIIKEFQNNISDAAVHLMKEINEAGGSDYLDNLNASLYEEKMKKIKSLLDTRYRASCLIQEKRNFNRGQYGNTQENPQGNINRLSRFYKL